MTVPIASLVTGAAGFVGYHLADHLSASGEAQVYLVDNFARGIDDAWFARLSSRQNVEVILGDLRDVDFVSNLPEVDYVYHLASINGTENFYSRPFEVLEAAVTPTLNLLKRYQEAPIRRFLLSSTSETYASTVEQFKWQVPTSEDVPLTVADIHNPRWSYAAAKIACEAAANSAFLQFKTPVTTVRYHNVFGPRMGNQHVIPQFIHRAGRGVYELYGAANQRSFIYVSDAVRLTSKVAQHPGSIGETYHIGTQEEVPMSQLAKIIMEIMGLQGLVKTFDAPEGSVMRRVPDTQKIEALLSDFSRVGLVEGLRETIAHYSSLSDPMDQSFKKEDSQ